jgi:hypothetical protein
MACAPRRRCKRTMNYTIVEGDSLSKIARRIGF